MNSFRFQAASQAGFEPATTGLEGRDAPQQYQALSPSIVQLVSNLREARLRYLLALVSSDAEERARRDQYGTELAECAEVLERAVWAVLVEVSSEDAG